MNGFVDSRKLSENLLERDGVAVVRRSTRRFRAILPHLAVITLIAVELLALDPSRTLEQYTRHRWSIEDGLPQVSVNTVIQDQRGYIWFGTFGGLVRFDGVRVEVVDSRGQCSSRILSLAVDHSGALWIGTERSGLCIYRDGSIEPYVPPDGRALGGIAEIIIRDDGNVLAATSDGVLKITGDSISRITATHGLPHDNALAVAEHTDGTLWIGTIKGLCITEDGRCTTPPWAAPLNGEQVQGILHGSDGTTWLATEIGLYQVRGETMHRIDTLPGDEDFNVVFEDSDGGIWVGLDPGGLRRILPRVERLDQIDRNGTHDTVREIFEDREGNLWLGTSGDGVIKLSLGAATGLLVRKGDEILPVLPIVVGDDGVIWAGTMCGGLAEISPGSTRFHDEASGMLNSCVSALLPAANGRLWVGTWGDGLYRKEADGTLHREAGPATPENLVRALAADDDGSVLVGTDSGLFRFDPALGTFRIVPGTRDLDIFYIDRNDAGEIWVGTRQGIRIITDHGIRRIGRDEGLSSDFVRAIYHDRDGVVWVGTYGGGLNRIEGATIKSFGTPQGLFEYAVSRIIEDREGRFWLTGNRGVTRVSREALNRVARGERTRVEADLFDASDGMPSTETNGGAQPAGALAPDGIIWIPTLSGIARFDSNRETVNTVPPPVYVERVSIDGREVDFRNEELVFPSSTRNLEIRYTALSFKAPEQVRFRYRLEGFDERWIDAGTRRTAYYPYIPAGSFQFHVIAANADGVWNATGDTLPLRVRPRFVETFWFYGLLGALLLLLSSLAWRARVVASSRRQKELEIEVERRTAELSRLSRLSVAINEAVTIEEVLDHLYENLEGVLPYDRIGLALLDEDRIILRAVWSRGRAAATGIDRGYEAPLSDSHSLKETLESGRPRLIRNLDEYLREHPDSESTRRILKEGIHSSLTCPLTALGQPVGFIFFSSFEPDTYDESHATFLQEIAGHLSMIVSKSRLYDDLVETKARLEQANRDLEHLAAVDSLTGLANRRAFDERLQSEWRRAQRSRDPVTILMIDVDHFKPFNDLYGHKTGDQCLQSIARSLSGNVRRAGDVVARYGGEEFAVILPQCEMSQGERVAETLRDTIERLDIEHAASDDGRVTISVGIATTIPAPDDTPESLVDRADRALYHAKRTGRNRVARYDDVQTVS